MNSLWATVELGKGSLVRTTMNVAKIRIEATIPIIGLILLSLTLLTPDKHDYGDEEYNHSSTVDE
jgi:hypothetical protein